MCTAVFNTQKIPEVHSCRGIPLITGNKQYSGEIPSTSQAVVYSDLAGFTMASIQGKAPAKKKSRPIRKAKRVVHRIVTTLHKVREKTVRFL